MFGFLLLTTSNIGLGLLSHCRNPTNFRYAALILRFLEGSGDVLLQFTGYSVITAVFSEELTAHIGYIEITTGLGLSMGPFMGALVYPYLAYEGTMYFFGFLCFCCAIMCQVCMPRKLN
jgi:MFS family permease